MKECVFQISWLKNKETIYVDNEPNFMQSADGHLIIVQVDIKFKTFL